MLFAATIEQPFVPNTNFSCGIVWEYNSAHIIPSIKHCNFYCLVFFNLIKINKPNMYVYMLGKYSSQSLS